MQDINSVPLITRREIEARIAVPLIRAFMQKFGRKPALEVAGEVIRALSIEAGEMLRSIAEGDGLEDFQKALAVAGQGGALKYEIVEAAPDKIAVNFTRCKFAEMYRSLGMEEFGYILSCGRDASIAEGFNPNIRFSRTQTIMEGADHCDFRYEIKDET
ncbi:MAG: L-2-amino-thiazoline-4-carboxylic acid hydrolase [Desulfobacterales bacterium]